MYGFACVLWRVSSNQQRTDKVDLLAIKLNLVEPKGAEDGITLKAGKHNFDLQFEIPSDCPSSFEGRYGRIRYVVKVIYVKSLFNTTKNIPFTVVNPLNLNSYDVNLAVSGLSYISKVFI